jgi:hypothetical protein
MKDHLITGAVTALAVYAVALGALAFQERYSIANAVAGCGMRVVPAAASGMAAGAAGR